MAQHYTPIWDDWPTVTRELNDQEKGRLIDAIVAYDNGGDWQERIKGNERYVFPGFQARIDRYKEANAGKFKDKDSETEKTEKTEFSESDKKIKKNKNSEIPKVKDKVKDKDIKETVLTDSKEKAAPAALDRAFDKFWVVYPRKVGKQDAKKAFLRLAPDDALLNTILTAASRQAKMEQWSEPRYIPHPATWLNGRRWEDEIPAQVQKPGKTVSANQYQQREYNEDDLESRLGVNDLFKEATG